MAKALLLIDVQNHWSSANPKTTQAIREALPDLRRVMPIVWIFMDMWGDYFQSREKCVQDLTPEALHELQPTIMPDIADRIFFKTDNDAFDNSRLADSLTERGISDLVMGGFFGVHCVLSTARGALKNRFSVSVARPLVADMYDRFHEENFNETRVRHLDKDALKKLCIQDLSIHF